MLSIYSSLYRCIKLTLSFETGKVKHRKLFDANHVNVGATKVIRVLGWTCLTSG